MAWSTTKLLKFLMKTFKLSYTEKEMLEAKDVCLNFDLSQTAQLAKQIGKKRIIFTGMGSSMIFPAKQAKNRALQYNIDNKVEAYFASDLFQYTEFSDTFLFLCSNSGRTKEVILLLEHARKHGATCVALTAVEDSLLAKQCDTKIILSCGFEKGVAATKSVVEQGLLYDSLIFHLAKEQGKEIDFAVLRKELTATGECIKQNVNAVIDKKFLDILTVSNHYFMIGLDNGVAEEITLKAYEITRKMALFYPDTHIVHGVIESIHNDIAIVFQSNAFSNYFSDFETFKQKTNCAFIGIDENSQLPGVNIAVNKMFKNYCYLAGGWGLLRGVANALSLDIDHPEKVSKVGNPYKE